MEPVRLVSRIEGLDDGGAVALSPDGSLLAVSSARFRSVSEDRFFDKGFVRVHDTDTGALRATATFDKFIWSVTFDPSGKRIAVTSGGDVWVVDALTGAQLWHFFSSGDALPPFQAGRPASDDRWNGLVGGEGLVTDFTGPGRVWLQTRSSADLIQWLAAHLPQPRNTG